MRKHGQGITVYHFPEVPFLGGAGPDDGRGLGLTVVVLTVGAGGGGLLTMTVVGLMMMEVIPMLVRENVMVSQTGHSVVTV